MKKDKIYLKVFLLGSILLFIWILIFLNKCSYISCNIQENIIEEEITTEVVNQQEKNIENNNEVQKPTTITPEIKFENICSNISNLWDLMVMVEEWKINIDTAAYNLLKKYFNKEITKPQLENELLMKIWEIDEEESIEQRLHLNFIFLKVNELEKWNLENNCNEIFNQYNK